MSFKFCFLTIKNFFCANNKCFYVSNFIIGNIFCFLNNIAKF